MNVLSAIAFRRGPCRPLIAAAAAAFLVLLSGSSGPAGLSAQTAREKPIQHEVTVAVKLVQVYVTGKGGAPVTDLTAADFTVVDNGKSYPVTHFEKHFIETGEPVISTPASPEIASPLNRKFFLVFDFAFMDPKAMLRSKSAALKFMDGELQPTDEIGVVTYQIGRGLVLNEYLTTDHARIRAIVEGFGAKAKAGRAENLTQFIYSSDLPMLKPDERATDLGAAVDVNSQFYEDQARAQAGQSIGAAGRQNYVDQARKLMIALGQMARVLRTVPGFKNIIMFSGGVASQYLYGKRGGATLGEWTSPEQLAAQLGTYDGAQASASLRDDYSAMIKEFKAANSPVYTIDVSRERMKGDVQTQTGVSSESLRQFEGEDSLRQIASGTGGKFYAKTMDEERVVEDIQGSTSAYYVLGYEVAETYDGKFHKIKVEVGRKGVDVTTQGGYFGAKPFKDFTRFEKLVHVVDLALSESPEVQVPFDIPAGALPVMVRGWSQSLVFARASQAVLAEVLGDKAEAYLLVIDDKGDVASIKRFTLPALATAKETLFPAFLLPVKPGRYTCRVVLRNLETGRAARGGAALVVPPEKVAVLLLDPPLLLAPDTKSGDLAAAAGGSIAGLFGYDPNAFAPLMDFVAPGTAKLQAALRIQGGAASTGLTVTATVVDLATSVRTDAPVTVIRQSDDGPTRLLVVDLATGELKPGRYALECLVKEPASGESAVSSIEFTVK